MRKALEWIAIEDVFSDVKLHGNIGWLPYALVRLVVLCALTDARQMTKSLERASKRFEQLFGDLPIKTFQGMVCALVTYSPQLLPRLWARFQQLMAQVATADFRIGKWLPLAVDGSRFDAPRTYSNERAFAAKNYGKGKQTQSRAKWKNKKKRSKKLSAPVKPRFGSR